MLWHLDNNNIQFYKDTKEQELKISSFFRTLVELMNDLSKSSCKP